MIRRITRLAGIGLLGAMVFSLAGVASGADTAKVRVLHASPDAPAVDIYLDDAPVTALTNVPFGTISGYLDIPAGDHNVKVFATGTTTSPVIDANVTVAAGSRYTIAATDAVASITAQVLEDQPSPSCDAADVRVIHFSADAPAVDVATAGATPDDAVIQDLAYPNATGYLELPAGSYDLEVRLADTTTVALALPGVAVEECNAYSVFAIGSAATPAVGGNALQVVVAVDATAEPAAEATLPATDTVGISSEPSAEGPGLGAVALAVVGLVAFSIVMATGLRRVRQD
jgi:hypothetical protein